MPRKGQRQKLTPDELAHNALVRYMEEHFEWMLVRGYSQHTITARRQHIRRFIRWADERGLDDPREITKPILERYQRFLFYWRKEDGSPLTLTMQYQYLTPLKVWFRWMSRANYILANPAADLVLPRPPKNLPRSVPSVQEVEAILSAADPSTVWGLRDRALLETLYASGIRRMEVAGLGVYDVDLTREVLWVRQGKGGRQRVVPLGERATAWLDKYLSQARAQLITTDTAESLFVTDHGEPVIPAYVADKVKHYMRAAEVHKVGSTHLLRHACATHMLEGGADIRFIQAMLGHANLETTQIYTQVAIDKLIEVHRATHPSRLQRQRTAAQGAQSPLQGPSLDEVREALLSAMDNDSEAVEDGDVDDAGDSVAADALRRR